VAANLVYHGSEKQLNIGGCLHSAMLRLPAHKHTLFNFVSQSTVSRVVIQGLLIQYTLLVKLRYEHICIGVNAKYSHKNI